MKITLIHGAVFVLSAATTASAQTVQPAHTDTVARVGYSVADVRFLQQMLAHHAQALRMTALVPARTQRPEMRLLAQRIEQSQTAEIAQMSRWLARRGERVPAVGEQAHDMTHMDSTHAMAGMTGMAMSHDAMSGMAAMPTMPGMLTEAQLAELAAASGAAFERLFLADMIRHHEGALSMVAELLATPGGAQEPEVDRISSDVDADQRAEIARMRAMLKD